MNINDLDYELFNELCSTKERLKYISGCLQESFTDNCVSKQLVTHEQLDNLISNTVDFVIEIIREIGDGQYQIEDAIKIKFGAKE